MIRNDSERNDMAEDPSIQLLRNPIPSQNEKGSSEATVTSLPLTSNPLSTEDSVKKASITHLPCHGTDLNKTISIISSNTNDQNVTHQHNSEQEQEKIATPKCSSENLVDEEDGPVFAPSNTDCVNFSLESNSSSEDLSSLHIEGEDLEESDEIIGKLSENVRLSSTGIEETLLKIENIRSVDSEVFRDAEIHKDKPAVDDVLQIDKQSNLKDSLNSEKAAGKCSHAESHILNKLFELASFPESVSSSADHSIFTEADLSETSVTVEPGDMSESMNNSDDPQSQTQDPFDLVTHDDPQSQTQNSLDPVANDDPQSQTQDPFEPVANDALQSQFQTALDPVANDDPQSQTRAALDPVANDDPQSQTRAALDPVANDDPQSQTLFKIENIRSVDSEVFRDAEIHKDKPAVDDVLQIDKQSNLKDSLNSEKAAGKCSHAESHILNKLFELASFPESVSSIADHSIFTEADLSETSVTVEPGDMSESMNNSDDPQSQTQDPFDLVTHDDPQSQTQNSLDPVANDGPQSQTQDPFEPVANDALQSQFRAALDPVANDDPQSQTRAALDPVANDDPQSQTRAALDPVANDDPQSQTRAALDPVANDDPQSQTRAALDPVANDDLQSQAQEPIHHAITNDPQSNSQESVDLDQSLNSKAGMSESSVELVIVPSNTECFPLNDSADSSSSSISQIDKIEVSTPESSKNTSFDQSTEPDLAKDLQCSTSTSDFTTSFTKPNDDGYELRMDQPDEEMSHTNPVQSGEMQTESDLQVTSEIDFKTQLLNNVGKSSSSIDQSDEIKAATSSTSVVFGSRDNHMAKSVDMTTDLQISSVEESSSFEDNRLFIDEDKLSSRGSSLQSEQRDCVTSESTSVTDDNKTHPKGPLVSNVVRNEDKDNLANQGVEKMNTSRTENVNQGFSLGVESNNTGTLSSEDDAESVRAFLGGSQGFILDDNIATPGEANAVNPPVANQPGSTTDPYDSDSTIVTNVAVIQQKATDNATDNPASSGDTATTSEDTEEKSSRKSKDDKGSGNENLNEPKASKVKDRRPSGNNNRRKSKNTLNEEDESSSEDEDEDQSTGLCKDFEFVYKKGNDKVACSCGFADDEQLFATHLVLNHLVYKPFRCAYCKRCLLNKNYMKIHIREKHREEGQRLLSKEWDLIGLKKAERCCQRARKNGKYVHNANKSMAEAEAAKYSDMMNIDTNRRKHHSESSRVMEPQPLTERSHSTELPVLKFVSRSAKQTSLELEKSNHLQHTSVPSPPASFQDVNRTQAKARHNSDGISHAETQIRNDINSRAETSMESTLPSNPQNPNTSPKTSCLLLISPKGQVFPVKDLESARNVPKTYASPIKDTSTLNQSSQMPSTMPNAYLPTNQNIPAQTVQSFQIVKQKSAAIDLNVGSSTVNEQSFRYPMMPQSHSMSAISQINQSNQILPSEEQIVPVVQSQSKSGDPVSTSTFQSYVSTYQQTLVPNSSYSTIASSFVSSELPQCQAEVNKFHQYGSVQQQQYKEPDRLSHRPVINPSSSVSSSRYSVTKSTDQVSSLAELLSDTKQQNSTVTQQTHFGAFPHQGYGQNTIRQSAIVMQLSTGHRDIQQQNQQGYSQQNVFRPSAFVTQFASGHRDIQPQNHFGSISQGYGQQNTMIQQSALSTQHTGHRDIQIQNQGYGQHNTTMKSSAIVTQQAPGHRDIQPQNQGYGQQNITIQPSTIVTQQAPGHRDIQQQNQGYGQQNITIQPSTIVTQQAPGHRDIQQQNQGYGQQNTTMKSSPIVTQQAPGHRDIQQQNQGYGQQNITIQPSTIVTQQAPGHRDIQQQNQGYGQQNITIQPSTIVTQQAPGHRDIQQQNQGYGQQNITIQPSTIVRQQAPGHRDIQSQNKSGTVSQQGYKQQNTIQSSAIVKQLAPGHRDIQQAAISPVAILPAIDKEVMKKNNSNPKILAHLLSHSVSKLQNVQQSTSESSHQQTLFNLTGTDNSLDKNRLPPSTYTPTSSVESVPIIPGRITSTTNPASHFQNPGGVSRVDNSNSTPIPQPYPSSQSASIREETTSTLSSTNSDSEFRFKVITNTKFRFKNGLYQCLEDKKNWKSRENFWWHLWGHLHKYQSKKGFCSHCYDLQLAHPKCRGVNRLLFQIEENGGKKSDDNSQKEKQKAVNTSFEDSGSNNQTITVIKEEASTNIRFESNNAEAPILIDSDEGEQSENTVSNLNKSKEWNNSDGTGTDSTDAALERVKAFVEQNKTLEEVHGVSPVHIVKERQAVAMEIRSMTEQFKEREEELENKPPKTEEEKNRDKLKILKSIESKVLRRNNLIISRQEEYARDMDKLRILKEVTKFIGNEVDPATSEDHEQPIPCSPQATAAPISTEQDPGVQKQVESNELVSGKTTPIGPATASTTSVTPKSISSTGTAQFFSCSLCRFSTLFALKFKKHLEEHEGQEIWCIHCGYISYDAKEFFKHFRGHSKTNLSIATFVCFQKACKKFQRNKISEFIDHINFYHSKAVLTCHCCENVFPSIETFQDHLQSSLLTIVKCPHCQAKATDKKSMLQHITKYHPNKGMMISITKHLICDDRKLHGFDPLKMLAFQSEWQNQDEGDDVEFIEYFEAPPGNTSSRSKTLQVKKEMESEDATLSTISTSPETQNTANLDPVQRETEMPTVNEHEIVHDSSLGVTHCQLPSTSLSSLDEPELPEHHLGYRCHQCSFVAERTITLDDHLYKHRNIHQIDDQKDFSCMFCPTTFNDLTEMENHLQHHDEKISFTMYECTLDGFKTNQLHCLKAHINDDLHQKHSKLNDMIRTSTVMLETKVSRCSKCDYKGFGKASIVTHEITHETPEKVSEDCGLSQTTKSNNVKPRTATPKSQKSEATGSKKCSPKSGKHASRQPTARPNIVSQSYYDIPCVYKVTMGTSADRGTYFDQFDERISKLYFSKNRQYHCRVCEKSCAMKRGIHDHLGKHLNIPYLCEICDLEDKQFSLLSNHMKDVHDIDNVRVIFPQNLHEKIDNLLKSKCDENLVEKTIAGKKGASKLTKRKFFVQGSKGIQTWTVDAKASKDFANKDMLQINEAGETKNPAVNYEDQDTSVHLYNYDLSVDLPEISPSRSLNQRLKRKRKKYDEGPSSHSNKRNECHLSENSTSSNKEGNEIKKDSVSSSQMPNVHPNSKKRKKSGDKSRHSSGTSGTCENIQNTDVQSTDAPSSPSNSLHVSASEETDNLHLIQERCAEMDAINARRLSVNLEPSVQTIQNVQINTKTKPSKQTDELQDLTIGAEAALDIKKEPEIESVSTEDPNSSELKLCKEDTTIMDNPSPLINCPSSSKTKPSSKPKSRSPKKSNPMTIKFNFKKSGNSTKKTQSESTLASAFDDTIFSQLTEESEQIVYECDQCTAKFYSSIQMQNHKNFLHRIGMKNKTGLGLFNIEKKRYSQMVKNSPRKSPVTLATIDPEKSKNSNKDTIPPIKSGFSKDSTKSIVDSQSSQPKSATSVPESKPGPKSSKLKKSESATLKSARSSEGMKTNVSLTTGKSGKKSTKSSNATFQISSKAGTSSGKLGIGNRTGVMTTSSGQNKKSGNLKRKSNFSSSSQPPAKKTPIRNNYKCCYCEEGFSSLMTLSKHFSLDHTDKEQILWIDVDSDCTFNRAGCHFSVSSTCVHAQKFLCYFCSFRGKKREIVKKHQKEKHGGKNEIIKLSEAGKDISNTHAKR